jgi:spore coat polysaccharide biosynthesis protein SpsF (cytidylyltransferase family)/aryl-alcohol dehydrogenase-like predicted oxidoreductase
LVSVAVLQARTNSSRLPGKVLLPIKGLPMAVLAANRAANTGRKVIVATSTEWSDDGLAATLEQYGLHCFRGSHENTLGRMVDALADYRDKTIVFRLTADNVFPDGGLLDELEAEFLTHSLDYLCCNGEPSGLPYGMSVEVTRLAHLREAARQSVDTYDQEHVTPYVIRKFGQRYFEKYKILKKGHFRCTVDCLDDYLVVQKVFSSVLDPIQVSSLELVDKLEGAPFQPRYRPTSKLVFGAAQLGSQYGIANKTGQPDPKTSQELLKTAIANGVTYIDTARAYGNSEIVIGQSLKSGWEGRAKIITKLSPMENCPSDALAPVVHAFVDASVFQSCAALGVRKIDVLMLHRASHLYEWGGAAWQRMLSLQSSRMIGALGVSVQNANELSAVLIDPDVRYIQMPFNLLDWRWDSVIPQILAAKASRGVTIHVRSALLQGLLPSLDEELWRSANVDSSAMIIGWLLQKVQHCQRKNIADLCLGYVIGKEWVDGVAIGIDNMAQLLDNIELCNIPPLSREQVADIDQSRPKLPDATLNPALWRK